MKYIYLCFSRRQSWYGKEIKSINQSHKKRDNWGTLFCLVPPVYQKADIFEIDFPSFVNYSQCQRECVADFRKPMLNLIEFVIWRKKWPRSLWQSSLFDRPRLCPSQYTLCYNYLFKAKEKKKAERRQKKELFWKGEKKASVGKHRAHDIATQHMRGCLKHFQGQRVSPYYPTTKVPITQNPQRYRSDQGKHP